MTKEFFLETEIGDNLVERLMLSANDLKRILILGSDCQNLQRKLQSLFPQAIFLNNLDEKDLDLIIANCYLHPEDNLLELFLKLHKSLTKNGLILFSSYGPDTLKELFVSNQWPDMHNIGDALQQAKFNNPVVDQEKYQIEYSNLADLFADLKQSDKYEIDPVDTHELNHAYVAEFEIIYAVAWANKDKLIQYKDQHGNVFIAADSIKVI